MTAMTKTLSSIAMALVAPLLFEPAHASDDCRPENRVSAIVARKGTTLSGPFAVEQLEAENMVTVRGSLVAVPFGYQNKAWEEMKAAMKPGDQIYNHAIDDGHFHAAYYVLVRDQCVIRSLMRYIT